MQISTSSWHYRFTDTFLGGFAERCHKGQHTTCSYIRAVFYALCACLLSVSFFGGLGLFALYLAGTMITVPILIFFFEAVKIPEVIVTTAAMGWMFVAIGLLVATINFIAKRASKWSEKRHSLMIQAMQDKKDGICTIVRIVD